MCQNVFKSTDPKERRQTFTRLFVYIAAAQQPAAKKPVKTAAK